MIRGLPGIENSDRIRTFPLIYEGGRIIVSGVDLGSRESFQRYPLLAGGEDGYEDVRQGRAVLISEPLARKSGLFPGGSLRLNAGVLLPIAGVFYDYSSEFGFVVMSSGLMEKLFGEGEVSSVAVYLRDVSPEAWRDTLQDRSEGIPLRVISSAQLKESVLRIFDETFAVVRVLQAFSLIIAVCGIALTLLVLAHERVAEVALYRALGALRRQIFQLFVGKGVAIAVLSSFLGVVGGLALAGILIFVINRAFFGWTIQIHVPWEDLVVQIALILLVSLVASTYPALKASRVPATQLSRDDL
jgi:putative ABC transport system permease protein